MSWGQSFKPIGYAAYSLKLVFKSAVKLEFHIVYFWFTLRRGDAEGVWLLTTLWIPSLIVAPPKFISNSVMSSIPIFPPLIKLRAVVSNRHVKGLDREK